MKYWIEAIRPKTLLASISPVILGLAIAFYEIKKIHLLTAFLTFSCALLLQIASNLANDYLDAIKGVDREDRLGPPRMTSKGLIPHSHIKKALFFCLFLAFFLGIYLMYTGGWFIIVIGFFSLYFAYGYTGGPFPLSYNALGEVAAFLFFGLVAVVGTSFLQTHHVSHLALVTGTGPGFISATILAVNNLRDLKSDTKSHKKTPAVIFGETFQRYFCFVNICCSFFVALYLTFSYHLTWTLPTLLLPFFFHTTWLQILYKPIDEKLNHALAKTAQYNFLYCLFLSAAFLLSLKT